MLKIGNKGLKAVGLRFAVSAAALLAVPCGGLWNSIKFSLPLALV